MSRAFALFASTIAVLSFAAGARAADEPKDIIARAIKAHGGEEYLTKHKGMTAKNKGTITIPGAGEVKFTQEMASMLPDKFKESLEMNVGGQNISVLTLVNGDKVVLEVNGKDMEIPEEAKAALKDAGHMMKVGRLTALLKDKGYELSLIGEDKVEGKQVVGVRVATKGQKDISLFFDTKTNLLTKVEYRGKDPFTQAEITEERIITEYAKNKDGVSVPKKLVVKHDGKTFLDVEVVESQYHEKVDDGEFKK